MVVEDEALPGQLRRQCCDPQRVRRIMQVNHVESAPEQHAKDHHERRGGGDEVLTDADAHIVSYELGAAARYAFDTTMRTRRWRGFPWTTLVINVAGSLLMGIVIATTIAEPVLRAILAAGFCGGFTTFSTASFEAVRLVEQRRYGTAVVQSLGTLILCLGAAAIGLALAP